MVSYDEQLRQNARELALQHSPIQNRKVSRPLLKSFYADMERLESFVRLLQQTPAGCPQAAEEWLLDNAEFLEEQAIAVKECLTDSALRKLPVLRHVSGEDGTGNALRIESLCQVYLDTADNSFDEHSFVAFVNAYQEVSVLTLAETWALPLVVRIAMIDRLAELMETVRERKEACIGVDRFLKQVDPQQMDTEKMNAALEEAGQQFPLSGPWVVHLIGHLREWADDAAGVRDWLLCKLENGSEDLNRIITYEHKLQAGYQMKAGHLITGLRELERLEWEAIFTQISLVEQALQQDQTGDYPRLDAASRDVIRKRIERIASRMHVPESLIAKQSIMLAGNSAEKSMSATTEALNANTTAVATNLPRSAFLAYYLSEPAGLAKLQQSLRSCSDPRRLAGNNLAARATGTYFSTLSLFFALALPALALWIGGGAISLSAASALAIVVALILPASEWAVVWLHFAIGCTVRTQPLLRYDFAAGVPDDARTMTVIPVIWSDPAGIDNTFDRLELHYLANQDTNIQFAVLGDYGDAPQAQMPGDAELLAYARDRVIALNAAYPREGEQIFHFFMRSRKWNEAENVHMGWERKRGKLSEFTALLRGQETSFSFISAEPHQLASIRYVITLDADTQLPIGSAQRMIGTMHLPYNRPRLNRKGTRIEEGYGMLQPRIGISYEGARQSKLTMLWSGTPGIDPYAFAVSDPYQDALGYGIFTGKGIFDVDVFATLLHQRIPENRVLSHDLLEGGFMRTGLMTDIELIDDHPAKFSTYQQRQHRWIRGDWQLICWLFPRVCDRDGVSRPVDLPAISRWQMLDNLRRSLMPIVYFVLLALGLTVLPGGEGRWMLVIGLTMLLPVIRQLAEIPRSGWPGRHLVSALSHVIVGLWMLPFQAAMVLDAVSRTLYRLTISKKRLLEWVSSADIERRSQGEGGTVLRGMPGGYALIALFALLLASQPVNGWSWLGLVLCLFWASAPLCARWLDRPIEEQEPVMKSQHHTKLLELSHEIWRFYADYAGARDHYLPPDNVQLEPANGVAHRTSPTNIGFLLTAVVSARDFGFIRTPEMVDRLDKTITTIERMDKWNGHLYNWYDTVTLAPLPPRYVSTVDSGNFVASLMAVKQGLLEWAGRDLQEDTEDRDRETYGAGAALATKFAAEFAAELSPNHLATPDLPLVYWQKKAEQLAARIESLITGTDFRVLYNDRSKLFVLGFHGDSGRLETILYDLLASEARQTSFVAIALGQVPVSHWFRLGRSLVKQGSYKTLVSWSGTMFEYMMPWLLMRTYRDTIWDSTYRGVVSRQIEYAQEHGVPYGISESGYYAFDHQMNYQYRAFGVPGLGFKRGLEEDLVLAPYATIMSLPYAVEEGIASLEQMEQIGARGKYGFYEAIDFTAIRLPEGQTSQTIRSYMAHHQGMSLLTLANMLLPYKMYDRFHADKRVQASELLLKERIPARNGSLRKRLLQRPEMRTVQEEKAAPIRSLAGEDTLMPEVSVHANGAFMTTVTNSGGGFSLFNGLAVTRWREDPVMDHWGNFLYIRDVSEDRLWSPSYQPCRVASPSQKVEFSLEKTTFTRTDGDVSTSLEIGVAAEFNAELRRLKLTNHSGEEKMLEVTTYLEIVLSSPVADESHQAFSKLFLETEYHREQEVLLVRRRPRESEDRPLWAVHALSTDGDPVGPAQFETSRSRFIGRGHSLARPEGIGSRLEGITGAVADPALVMRRLIQIPPGASAELVALTGVAYSREEALEIARSLSQGQQVERAFQSAWTRNKIEQRHLQISPADAVLFQRLAGRVLYSAPLVDAERSQGIVSSVLGQSGLWSHGVSGERPIVQLRIADVTEIAFAMQVFQGHEYLRRLGLAFDLVVLIASQDGYQQALHEELQRVREQIVRHDDAKAGDIVMIPLDRMSEAERDLFTAVARLHLRADGPSLKAQLRIAFPDRLLPKPAPYPVVTDMAAPTKSTSQPESLLFDNGWGGFKPSGKEYAISIREGRYLPAPWINVMANPQFGTFVSELGTGYSWWRNSRECKLTPWSNDPAMDKPGEALYLRDEESGAYWPFAAARGGGAPAYEVIHGRGYTVMRQQSAGLVQEMTTFVPIDEPLKVIRLKLKNDSSTRRSLSLTYYAEWVIGVRREGNAPYIVSEWEDEVLTARNAYQETFREATAFLAFSENGGKERTGSIASMETPRAVTYTSDRREFIGRGGSMERPAAMGRLELSNNSGTQYESCGAIRTTLQLEPNEEQTLYVLLGCTASGEEARALVNQYRQPGASERALDRQQRFWSAALEQVSVSTPSPEMDLMLNNWLLYQTLACRMWARTAFYQAGGAYGFRDQLQDSLALLHSMPHLTREQIILHASHQYEEGDVQHWWHEETERGIRTRFSDDLLWLPYAVSRYIEHTGDGGILDEKAPYLHSGPLQENEHERYEETRLSGNVGPIFEHCLRVIDRSLTFGEHGLPLFGCGDWNDGMSRVGIEGRGESVWLGWFLCDVLKRFIPICLERGETERGQHYEATVGTLSKALDNNAWDGQWYRRAFHDSGQWLGTASGKECRIDAIAQSWSVLSGEGNPDKVRTAMHSFDRELVDRNLGVVALLTPPFDNSDPSPGYIQGYPPGIRENGGQYTHGVLWSIAAWCELQEGDKAFELFHMLNPINHTKTPGEVKRYVGEPYAIAADVYTTGPLKGHAGWTWYTGASGWMYQVGLESILGIRRRADRLYMKPCIPHEWPGYTVQYRHGEVQYRITVRNPEHKMTGWSKLVVDGQEVDRSQFTAEEGPFITLAPEAGRGFREIELTL